ncbi:hypothetical protein N7516_011098 [Penicillium verrucosum]|uniref:uncharacterized protein n=1 Tax=Penicillium verrucosum TaxID=60171 RepID=UPI00254556CB|nr:uncharacterized protein N7516_011098 [Penicillium verrucosum]KAJ5920240.1 hypothetical protein N7516_011098 [Penicillium verrucosum]
MVVEYCSNHLRRARRRAGRRADPAPEGTELQPVPNPPNADMPSQASTNSRSSASGGSLIDDPIPNSESLPVHSNPSVMVICGSRGMRAGEGA